MSTTRKVIYKNHCTPQEQIIDSGRYYLDSDCGRKLSGSGSVDANTDQGYQTNLPVDDSFLTLVSMEKHFLFVKNIGGGNGNDVLISFNAVAPEYLTRLASGESLAVETRGTLGADGVVAICDEGEDTTLEVLTGEI